MNGPLLYSVMSENHTWGDGIQAEIWVTRKSQLYGKLFQTNNTSPRVLNWKYPWDVGELVCKRESGMHLARIVEIMDDGVGTKCPTVESYLEK